MITAKLLNILVIALYMTFCYAQDLNIATRVNIDSRRVRHSRRREWTPKPTPF